MAPYEETIFVLAVLSTGAFAAWLVARHAGERARERERRARVVEAQIERFGDTHDFLVFAQSDVGLFWIKADAGEVRVVRGLLLLGLMGILSLALGVALLVNAAGAIGAVEPADAAASGWWGVVLVGLGLGACVALVCLNWLARRWGLGVSAVRARGADER